MPEHHLREPEEQDAFRRAVAETEARKLKARRHPQPGVWFGFSLFGLVGWSIALPTVLGAALGLWIDRRHPSGHSWTLMLLITGLLLGCLNAWRWVAKEHRDIREETEDENE